MTALRRLVLLAAAFVALLLAACFEDPMAGGTDEVENPALNASLHDGRNQALSGTLRIFARYQNPTRDSSPVLTLPAAGSAGAEIRAKTLLAAMDSASRAGLPWLSKDTLAFNLVGSTAAEEAFAADFVLFKAPSGKWLFRRDSPKDGGDGNPGSLSARLSMAPAVVNYRGSVGAKGVELGLMKVFIPGSPWHASIGLDGEFVMPRLAAGSHDVKALDASGKVYGSLDSLRTESPFAPRDWSEADLIWLGD